MFQIRNYTNHIIKSISTVKELIVIDIGMYISFVQGYITVNGEQCVVTKEHQLRAHNQETTKYMTDIADFKLTIMFGNNIDCDGEFYKSVKIILEQNIDNV